MKRLVGLGVLLMLCCGVGRAAEDEEKGAAKEALQALNDYIGSWKGTGAPDKPRPEPRELWNEQLSWSWRFKGDDAWLVLAIDKGKYFKKAELRFLVDKKRYELTARTKEDKKLVFLGELKNDVLTLERVDPDTKETQRLRMNLAGGGVRFVYGYEHKPAGRTLFSKDYRVGLTKEGESFGVKEKKVECVVTGGLGTIPVSYKGVTYYVCCSGCKDAFNDNPEKYIKEYEARKAGKK
jgi:hypothetical protein